jgi:methylated-DNA-[protein]-cysteine S-methyltransferase
MKKLYVNTFETEWGKFRTAATDCHLVLVSLPGESQKSFEDSLAGRFGGYSFDRGGDINWQAEKEIRDYVAGKLKRFTVEIDIKASPFQKKVLKQVAKIPFGQTKTYGEIAAIVGNPGASRAVGTANARNNLPLIIPCHRVLASNGLGGYGGGLALKRKLLRHEGVSIT